MMKNKVLVLISILLITLSCSLFAAETTTEVDIDSYDPSSVSTYSFIGKPYTKMSARMQSMGGAGLAVRSNQDALYVNPASLGEKGIVFNTPNLAVTFYNFQKLASTDSFKEALNNPTEFTNQEILVGMGSSYLNAISNEKGNNALADIDAGVGFKFGRFAFAVDTKVRLLTYSNGDITAMEVIPQVDVVASAGLGLRFFREKPINFDIGVAARLDVRAYTESIMAQDILNNYSQIMTLVETKPVLVGYSIPVDVGLNINFPAGFTVSSVLRNINGNFNMTAFENYKGISDNLGLNILSNGVGNLNINVPMTLDAGLGWSPDLGGWEWLADFTLAADVVDILSLSQDFSVNNLLLHSRLGAEIQIFKGFEFRGGLNSGYVTLGAGLNIFNLLHIEVSYYKQEFGKNIGDRGVDALTIRFNTIWER